MATQIIAKTWRCSNYPFCPFAWNMDGEMADIDPHDLTVDQIRQEYHEAQFWGLLPGHCPSCYLKGIDGDLYLPTDTSMLTGGINIAEDSDIAAMQVEELDTHGNVVMVESEDLTTQKLINDNGTARFVEEPVLIPKMREQTKKEQSELKEQRDNDLDAHESLAVQEITE